MEEDLGVFPEYVYYGRWRKNSQIITQIDKSNNSFLKVSGYKDINLSSLLCPVLMVTDSYYFRIYS